MGLLGESITLGQLDKRSISHTEDLNVIDYRLNLRT